MSKNKFRNYHISLIGEGTAQEIMNELKALVNLYEQDRSMPTGEMEGPALLVKIKEHKFQVVK